MPWLRQTSFAGGELAPRLYGRDDYTKYGTGLRTCRNFFISQHGAAVSRPGTRYIGNTKDDGAVRLVPFVYSDDTSYVLEFGDGYVRFLRDGAYVAAPAPGDLPVYAAGVSYSAGQWVSSGGSAWYSLIDGNLGLTPGSFPSAWTTFTVYQIASPFTAAQLPRLKFTQSGDVLTLVHRDASPHQLTRSGEKDWEFEQIAFDVPAYFGPVPRAFDRATNPPKDADGNDLTQPTQTALPARKWRYKVSQVRQRSDGRIYETEALDVLQVTDGATTPSSSTGDFPDLIQLGPEWPQSLMFRTDAASNPSGDLVLSTRVYRGREGIFGYIGSAIGQQNTDEGGFFRDEGHEPDYTITPPAGTNPFKVYDGAGDLLRVEEPVAVGYYEGRQVFVGTEERPARIWCSRTNSYGDFDKQTIPTADGPVEIELAQRKREEVRGMLALDRLLVFTQSSVWAVGGSEGAPLAPTNLNEARVQTEIGSSWLDPLVIDGNVLFVRAKGCGVRDLYPSEDRRGYASADLSLLAQHLFEGHEIDDWTYAEDPWSLVWAVRDDGVLLCLTYSRNQDVWAWSQHTLGGDGVVENVCAVPEESEDGVYLVVVRLVDGAQVRHVERLTSRVITSDYDPLWTEDQAVCLDASITTVKTSLTGPQTVSVTGLGHLEGCEVYGTANGAVIGPYTVSGGAIDVEIDTRTVLHIGLPYTAELELLDVPTQRDKQKRVKRVQLEVEASRGLWTGTGPSLWAGESTAEVTEWRQRIAADSYSVPALHTGEAEITIRSSYTKHGRALVQQRDPLPLTVTAFARDLDLGG